MSEGAESPAGGQAASDVRLKILVADDNLNNLQLLQAMLGMRGHEVVVAHNGAEAVRKFVEEQPEVVLMDVLMPEMNGYEATRRIKALTQERWVPLIFLSALDRVEDMVVGLQSGGDDYLPKPINLGLLEAKIAAMQRIAVLQRQILAQKVQLENYYFQSQEENRIAAHLLDILSRLRQDIDPRLRQRVMPATIFSGDIIAAAHAPNGDLHLMIADASGHGLSAAINVLPVVEAFHAMTGKGFPLSSIAAEINRKIRALLPIDRFVATGLAAIDFKGELLHVWNGGVPPMLLLDGNGKSVHRFDSRYLPLGLCEPEHFISTPETVHFTRGMQFISYSDGLTEAQDAEGREFGLLRLLDILARSSPAERMDEVLCEVSEHLGGVAGHDDISLLVVDLDRRESPLVTEARKRHGGAHYGEFHATFRFGPQQLRKPDLLPNVLDLVAYQIDLGEDRDRLHLVLGELFSNALDHGLLRLPSSLRVTSSGIEQYMRLREDRLEALNGGHIEVVIETVEHDGEEVLALTVADNGEGFDYLKVMCQSELEDNVTYHGRGIALVRSMVTELSYHGSGNVVRAIL